MGVFPYPGRVNFNFIKQIGRAPAGFLIGNFFMNAKRLNNLVADPAHGVKRIHCPLEYDRNLFPADPAQLVFASPCYFPAIYADAAAHNVSVFGQ